MCDPCTAAVGVVARLWPIIFLHILEESHTDAADFCPGHRGAHGKQETEN